MGDNQKAFQVPLGMHLWGGIVHDHHPAWVKIGDFETALLRDDIVDIEINSPVYINGLARAGSTLLLEILSGVPGVVTHRYSDYPFIFTPYFWNNFLRIMPQKKQLSERAHGDGIEVSVDSPEAMEEMLWMAFFDHLHDVRQSNLIDQSDCKKFEKFYKEHIKKLLYVRNGKYYVAKGNYNTVRSFFISEIFPDAKFLIPVRHPVTHVASLMRQHQKFTLGCENNPRGLAHLQRVGHFEFGLDRRPLNLGDDELVQSILRLWKEGEEVRGWARYWAMMHRYISKTLEQDKVQKKASLVVRFEDLCAKPREQLNMIFQHCGLMADDDYISRWADQIRVPNYYDSGFGEKEIAIIKEEAFEAASYFGYDEAY